MSDITQRQAHAPPAQPHPERELDYPDRRNLPDNPDAPPIARYPNDGTFDQGFTDDEKKKLGDLTAAVGIPYFTARHFKPWFLTLTLSIPPCVQITVLQGKQGVDGDLRKRAQADGKPVIGLETLQEQVDALATLDRGGIGTDALKQLIAAGQKAIEDQMATQIALYREERPALSVFLGRHLPELNMNTEQFPTVMGVLIHDRNLRFRDRLQPLLEEGGTFVAVGAMHLVDKDGLVELLRAGGYQVTRVD
jgi:uncharacterized protein YbaP (TraB family)